MLKKCSFCKKELPLNSFQKNKTATFGVYFICKICRSNWYKNNRGKVNKIVKKYRHKKGISKKYNTWDNISSRVEYKRLYRKRYKYLRKNGGELPINRVQLVYEDNIKKYGTLTCYLCEQPIQFGKDHLEHKNPLSRGGTNEYKNLAIACQTCNCKKHNKTVEEYMEVLKSNEQ